MPFFNVDDQLHSHPKARTDHVKTHGRNER